MNIRNANINDMPKICELWNTEVASLGFYKPLEEEQFIKVFTNDPDFSYEGVFVAYDEDKLVKDEIEYALQINCRLYYGICA